MNCPSCNVSCSPENYEGVTIEVCDGCKGVWLSQSNLREIVKKKEKSFKLTQVDALNRLCGVNGVPKEEESRQLACPHCGITPMNTQNYNYSSSVIIDRCPKNCGLWLDADELEKIQIHSEIWMDKLEANRDRFNILSGQVEEDIQNQMEAMAKSIEPNRFKFVNSILRGLIKFD